MGAEIIVNLKNNIFYCFNQKKKKIKMKQVSREMLRT